MRDYLFYPFALTKPMQRFGKWATSHWGKHFGRVLPAAVANLLVFAVVGIWHGPQAHYLAWGLYNGLVIALADLLEPAFKKAQHGAAHSYRKPRLARFSHLSDLYHRQHRLVL